MDWWRAKLVLIAAFLCLDLALAWQVRQMHLPAIPGVVLHGPPGATSPAPLPVLEVRWLGWQVGDAQLVPGSLCGLHGDVWTCPGPSGASEVDWAQGALVYTDDRSVPRLRRTASAARNLVLRLNPGIAAADVTAIRLAAPRGARQYAVVENYEGMPLFNAQWNVQLGPGGTLAQRWWLQVIKAVTAPQPLISPRQASAEAARIYTSAAVSSGQAPVLGYYGPQPSAPQADWQVFPVYRIRLRNEDCIYVDAVGGTTAFEAAFGGSTALEAACWLLHNQGSG